MKNRKKLLSAIALVVIAAGCLTTWAITRASTKPKPMNTRYLETFFHRYVASLNGKSVGDMMSFYGPDCVSVQAWGMEMDNVKRAAYLAACKEAFPTAVIEVRKVIFEPTSETSGTITWDFGMKAGPQAAPFMGVYNKVDKPTEPRPDGYDQVGVSTGYVTTLDRAALDEIKGLEERVAALDKEIISLDEKIASINDKISAEKGPNGGADGEGSSHAAERFSLAEKRADLAAERAEVDQQLLGKAVSSIKFIRQSSFQNMDGFLKKIGRK